MTRGWYANGAWDASFAPFHVVDGAGGRLALLHDHRVPLLDPRAAGPSTRARCTARACAGSCPCTSCRSSLALAVIAALSGFALNTDPLQLAREVRPWLSFGFLDTGAVNGVREAHIVNAVYWTLACEWSFYLALPLLANVRARPRLPAARGAGGVLRPAHADHAQLPRRRAGRGGGREPLVERAARLALARPRAAGRARRRALHGHRVCAARRGAARCVLRLRRRRQHARGSAAHARRADARPRELQLLPPARHRDLRRLPHGRWRAAASPASTASSIGRSRRLRRSSRWRSRRSPIATSNIRSWRRARERAPGPFAMVPRASVP